MIPIKLTNSLSRKTEVFTPIDSNCVRMYACGPTVYDRPHVGNVRAAVVYDILFRLLRTYYPNVIYARNITDVDDKIIIASIQNNEPIATLTTRVTGYYHADVAAVGCLPPTVEPHATTHIAEMIEMIQTLIDKENAYIVEGHVLFAVSSYAEYGKLARRSRKEMIAGARVEVAPYKRDPGDFVLWKPAKAGEEGASFASPWGQGRPGWHIECSAMSKKHLGQEFDIHGGGADLMFPHHENELAQSACANEHPGFARYWVHNGFLTVEGEKMSKSLGNFYTARELLDSGIEGVALRYFYLTTHYRKPLDYSTKAIQDAANAMHRFRTVLTAHQDIPNLEALPQEVLEALADDLNTPRVLAYLHEYASQANRGDTAAAAKLQACCEWLGLDLSSQEVTIPAEVIALAESRKQAKALRNWAVADALRAEIAARGYTVRDLPDNGYRVEK